MKEIVGILISLIGLSLQSSFSGIFGFEGVKPDILLVVVVFYAYFYGYERATFFGLALGLIEDLFLGGFLGGNIFIKMMVGFFVGLFSRNIYKDTILLPMLVIFASTILSNYLHWAIINIFVEKIEVAYLLKTALIQSGLNMCLVPVFYINMYFRRKK